MKTAFSWKEEREEEGGTIVALKRNFPNTLNTLETQIYIRNTDKNLLLEGVKILALEMTVNSSITAVGTHGEL